jgi:hypothetical protein
MKSHTKAKSFQDRMSHRGSGMAVGEMRKGGKAGMSAGEKAVGLSKKRQDMVPPKYKNCQSKDGNGGNGGY